MKGFHLCSPLRLHSLVLKSSRSMWDCCLLTHPSIRLNASPPTHHFDCPTCWKREAERNREDGKRKRRKYERKLQYWIRSDFITTKKGKHNVRVNIKTAPNMINSSNQPWGFTEKPLIPSLCFWFVSKINSNFANQESSQRITSLITMETVCHTILF